MKQEIRTEIKGIIVKYREKCSYSKDDFSIILKDKEEFKIQFIDRIKRRLSSYNREIINPKVEFNLTKRTMILTGKISGALSKTGDEYYSTFGCLLRLLSLDFINDNFKESKQDLFWRGKIKEMPGVKSGEILLKRVFNRTPISIRSKNRMGSVWTGCMTDLRR